MRLDAAGHFKTRIEGPEIDRDLVCGQAQLNGFLEVGPVERDDIETAQQAGRQDVALPAEEAVSQAGIQVLL